MKFSATLALVASLATQAFTQEHFLIQPKGKDLALTEPATGREPVLVFDTTVRNRSQLWTHEETSPKYKFRNVETGDYLNCGPKPGPCFGGSEPQEFEGYQEGDEYFFVTNGFKSILSYTNSSQLRLAPPESDYVADKELFVLKPAYSCK